MYFVKSLVAFVTAAAVVSAMPGMDRRIVNEGILMRETACNNHTGDCSVNDCNPTFHHPDDTTGYCTSGTFKKCPCSKCGSDGDFLCEYHLCNGKDGKCTTNLYQGCPCLEINLEVLGSRQE